MTPWYRFLTDLGDRGGETAIISIHRAALVISVEFVLLPQQNWMCGDVQARPVGDIFSKHMSTH